MFLTFSELTPWQLFWKASRSHAPSLSQTKYERYVRPFMCLSRIMTSTILTHATFGPPSILFVNCWHSRSKIGWIGWCKSLIRPYWVHTLLPECSWPLDHTFWIYVWSCSQFIRHFCLTGTGLENSILVLNICFHVTQYFENSVIMLAMDGDTEVVF